MQTFAAIDIGSNSCRLKIARVLRHQLRLLHEDREVTRLGTGVFESGLVSPDAMAVTLRALKRFQRAVQTYGAGRVRAVATAALRDARNGRVFLAWVKGETGWDVEIISGLEEARLIHSGVMSAEADAPGRKLLIDLGGGSCEITVSERRRIVETVSLPLGAVRLTQEFLKSDPPAKDEIARMKKFIGRELRRAARKIDPSGVRMVIATSGTAAALAAASRGAKPGNGKPANGSSLTLTDDVARLTTKLTRLNGAARAAVPGIGPRRAEIIVAGAHVFTELLERFDLPGLRYSEMGLRDGILAQMLAEGDGRTPEHQQYERDRWAAVVEVCHRYGVDPRQAEPVREHAAQLFDDLIGLHQLPAEYRTWIEAAALLCETGKFLNYQGHHRHAQYIIANSELFGFTPTERVITSAIARYLGKSRPEPDGRTMRQVPVEEYERVRRAIALLRLAVALNQDRASDVLRVRARMGPKRVRLEINPGRTGAELEMWSLRKEAAYFREVFRRELLVVLL